MICSLYKFLLSRSVTEDAPLSDGLKRHLEKCRGCRDFYSAHKRIASQLKHSAHPAAHGIAAKPTFRAAGQMTAKAKPATGGFWKPALSAAAAVILVAGMFLWLNGNSAMNERLECLDDSAAAVVSAPVMQYEAIKNTAGINRLDDQYASLQNLTAQTFRMVFDSFTAATDVPGLERDSEEQL